MRRLSRVTARGGARSAKVSGSTLGGICGIAVALTSLPPRDVGDPIGTLDANDSGLVGTEPQFGGAE
jgi:hypothetical protein